MKNILKLIIGMVIGLLAFSAGSRAVVAAPPENFQVEQIVTSGLDGPSGFEIAPDGRIFVLERTGKIKIIKNGVLLAEPFADLPSAASGDRGLIGIAFDPGFGATNHYVYFYYTGLDKLNRLVRFDASTDVGQNGPFLLYQTNSPSEELHVGGSIRFGPDGKMYFAVGDNGYPPNAQNLGNPHGKILRINRDGSIPLDNPFVGQPGVLPEIWAYGFRNPWRFQFDSETGYLYGSDVGDFTWEEMNHIRKGMNYGWPVVEGMCYTMCSNYVNPIYTYNHDNESAAATGGPVYRAEMFPEEYRGDLFFADYAKGFIKRIDLSESGSSLGVYDFDVNAGSVVDLKIAPDGSMYYITYYPGRMYRVSYTTGNHIPTANATADNDKGVEPHTVTFSSAGSSDPDGDPLTYLWSFGDGTTSTAANPVKTYTQKGTYTVDLAVSDGVNTSHAVALVIQVGIPPSVNIGEPTNGSSYRAGDTIHWTASALDGAGFDIDDRDISTEILLHHGTHIHPFLGPIIGRQGQFTVPTTGEASADTWFEIKVTATDTNGLETTKSTFVYPVVSQVTLQTQPAGMNVYLDGVPRSTTTTFNGVVNFRRELNAPATQMLNGVEYEFVGWSDNQPQRHFIAVQENPSIFTAIYQEATPFAAEFYNNTTLSGQPVVTRNDTVVDFDWGDGSPDPLIPINFFSARWTKTAYFAGGNYTFKTTTDDGVRLYVDGQILIDKWQGGLQAHVAEVEIAAGEHEIVMEFLEEAGGARAQLEWQLAAAPVTEVGFYAEYFNNITLSGAPKVIRDDAEVNFVWDYTSPDPQINTDNFSVRWTKTEEFPAGIYEFHTTSDDGVRLYVDGELILNNWVDQATTSNAVEKALEAGSHTIILEYYEHEGGAVAIFDYHKHADLPTVNNFTGEYFANKTLTGAPALTREDSLVNFVWDGGSPDPIIPIDNFSVRWTKTETLDAGTYEFAVTGDDGVRLYVDGELLVDKWIDQGATTYKVSKSLTAGQHTVVMEYYEAGGGAVAKLAYAKVSDTPPPPLGTGYTGQYFNNTEHIAPVAMTRNDEVINFDWAGASPDPLINANDFSVRWTKVATLTEGVYEFTTTADDGVRIKVDGETILDKWIYQGATTYTVQKALTAGEHTIVIEYFEAGGGAVMRFNFAKVTDAPTETYEAKYWNVPVGIPAPAIPVGAPTVTRNDATIDFVWDGGSPDAAINTDGFVAQWTRKHTFEDATYTFTTVSDDGIRVYVDNELVIDQWNDHGSTTHTGTKVLTAGEHTIKVEYYENNGGAVAKFSFEKTTGTPPPPPPADGFNAEYFNSMDLSGLPALTRVDAQINFVWGMAAPDPVVNADKFSVRWTKQKQYAAGTYSFTVKSDDGVRFWVDDQLLVDDWTDHALTIYNPTVTLTEGVHTLKIEFYDNTQDAIMIFEEH